ncbi:type III effector Hop protein [Clostridium botulinum]|uniref:Type III effector Hop protein n=1 Tax=Clostridium botulinum TaxID=1491 RepID=A0AAU8YX56_CLOBO|nr:four-carbon acid sugar kinase family protein [Clostridium sporogenes]AVP63794.1 type III effector Hop protein [Clostridium botulinum]MCF4017320.1 four-carbon acid sugar kinase family protein [Clostridium sporogenes]NFG01259.1 four-carbon acid sugar kinase family protein [Clostridium sporogenes]
MLNYVIIADDLTGANATGVLIKKLGLKPVTLMNSLKKDDLEKSYDTVLYSTDSRGVEKEDAYERVYQATEFFFNSNVNVYGKRIDSTLRGNIGSEIDGMLDALPKGTIAAVVPAFPEANRQAVGGYLLVNGKALENSDAAKDGKKPINSSIIEKLVKEQSKYEVASIYFEDIKEGCENLQKKILKFYDQGKKLIIFDALDNDDLEIISKALINTKIKFISVDPGPFTAEVIKQHVVLDKESKKDKNKVLMSIGSITDTTRAQLERISKDRDIFKIDINARAILSDVNTKHKEIDRVTNEVIENKDLYDVFCIVLDSLYEEVRINLDEEGKKQNTTKEFLSQIMNTAVAEISYRIMKEIKSIKGIFSSGGDISVSISRKFNSAGLELLDEVMPLAAYGKFIEGEFPDMKIVSKGGMVGKEDGMELCVDYLLKNINCD